jgi:primosomal protein N' (replication factor Y)
LNQSTRIIVKVVVDRPLQEAFDYLWNQDSLRVKPQIGMLVEVPFGRISLVGLIIEVTTYSELKQSKLKAVLRVAPLIPLNDRLMELGYFASQYYIHGLGETLVSAIPKWWRTSTHWNRPLQQLIAKERATAQSNSKKNPAQNQLNEEQTHAIQILSNHQAGTFNTYLLNGVTGSGKTAVYLTFIESLLKLDRGAQALIMLPEINLTPQLQRRIQEHFPAENLAILHSGLTEKQRGIAWHQAMTGAARIVLGTRLSIMTPLPKLVAIIVDEENDSSFKQQGSWVFSARPRHLACKK